MAQESWWPWHRVSEFKLRASQGTAGTRPDFADQYETYTISSNGTLAKSALGNRFLKPETARETEFGLDMIVDNRYSLQISQVFERTTDELVQVPLPGAIGFTTQWQNAGTVVGRSLEASFEAQLLRRGSTTWRMASESWWPWKAFNEFKLRASQGTAGGRPDFNDQYETFSFTEGGGLEKATLGNKFLKPELATEREFGVDAIFRNRFSLQLSYARSKVQDQLILVPLPGFFGYTAQWQNAGTVEGNTWEGTLEAQLVQRPNFTWRLGLVADRSRNRITEFNRSCFTTNTIAYRCAGETLGAMYGFRFIGGANELPADAASRAAEFQVNDEGLLVWVGPGNAYTDGETKHLWGTTTTIGTTNYGWGMPITLKDATGSSAVVKIGDGNPDFHFGVSNNVSWRNFTAFALVDAQVGGQVYNQTNQRMYQWGRSADVDQVGKAQEKKKPVDYYVALYAANDPTGYFVEDAGFVKLREVSLRYRFGRQLTSALARFGAEGASVAVIGRNLLTLTGYKGYDPEVGGVLTRLDSFDYPRYRTITGSFEISF
jgi:hypothetical protein